MKDIESLRFWARTAGLHFAVESCDVGLPNRGYLSLAGGVDDRDFRLNFFVDSCGIDGWD
jgi:hypothetical protein